MEDGDMVAGLVCFFKELEMVWDFYIHFILFYFI